MEENSKTVNISSEGEVLDLNSKAEKYNEGTSDKTVEVEGQNMNEDANLKVCVRDHHSNNHQNETTDSLLGINDNVNILEKTAKSLECVHDKNNAKEKDQTLNEQNIRNEYRENKSQYGKKIEGNSETEEGELHDSGDETIQQKSETSQTNAELDKDKIILEVPGNDFPRSESKEQDTKIAIGIDEVRPEEEIEQLDYDEDVVENKESSLNQKSGKEFDEEVQSDGEALSDEGEIKEDENDDVNDFEEGETRDHPGDVPQETKVCKFFQSGTCTWGEYCRFVHPGINDKGNYDMFKGEIRQMKPAHRPEMRERPPPFWNKNILARPHMSPPPVTETAWERGLRHAKELKRRAIQRKVHEPDFVQKREIISLNSALNEDRDMEFVDHRSLADANKGYDPFQQIEEDEYAVPPPEELRRGRLMRDDRMRKASPHFRNDLLASRASPPVLPLNIEQNQRDRTSPSIHHHPADLSRISPSKSRFDNEKGIPLHNVSLYGQPRFNERDKRERSDHFHQRGRRRPDEVTSGSDIDRRNLSHSKDKDYRESLDQINPKNSKVVNPRSEQWSDPWARPRPATRGKNKENAGSRSSSSSSSVSGSSSRSSSRSSNSSHSSYSGSSRSSSRSSATSRSSSYSSHSDTSRSPSPIKTGKAKRKVLASKQQNIESTSITTSIEQKKGNFVADKDTDPTVFNKDLLTTKQSEEKYGSTPAKNILQSRGRQAKRTVAKATGKNKRTSSSSSEFSHSDSSASPSPSKGKKKNDSDSHSQSSSSDSSDVSSSDSSSTESEDDNLKSKKGKTGSGTKVEKKSQAVASTGGLQNNGKVKVPSKPGRKDVQMTISEKHAGQPASRKRSSVDVSGHSKKGSNRRVELLEQLKAVEDAIARKRAKMM